MVNQQLVDDMFFHHLGKKPKMGRGRPLGNQHWFGQAGFGQILLGGFVNVDIGEPRVKHDV